MSVGRRWSAALAALALAHSLTACAVANGEVEPLSIFAASSLQDVLPSLADAYRTDRDAPPIQLSFDASSRLRAQIAEGAPAHLFLSADERNVQLLVAGGMGKGGGIPYTANRLVLVAAQHSDVVAEWTDLAADGVRIVTAGDEVPISQYTAELIERLARSALAPPNFRAAYDANVVSREDNVRAVLAKVEIGEADAAVVYATDARASSQVRIVPLPDDISIRVTYSGLVLDDGAGEAAAAMAFLEWLRGPQAAAVLAEFGFAPVT